MQTHQLQAREELGPPGPLAAPSQSSAGPSVSQKPVQTAAHCPRVQAEGECQPVTPPSVHGVCLERTWCF